MRLLHFGLAINRRMKTIRPSAVHFQLYRFFSIDLFLRILKAMLSAIYFGIIDRYSQPKSSHHSTKFIIIYSFLVWHRTSSPDVITDVKSSYRRRGKDPVEARHVVDTLRSVHAGRCPLPPTDALDRQFDGRQQRFDDRQGVTCSISGCVHLPKPHLLDRLLATRRWNFRNV